MKVLLTSKGIVSGIRSYFLSVLPDKPENAKLAFITTAAYGERKDPVWLEKDIDLIRGCGVKDIQLIDIKDKSSSGLKSMIAEKDAIYVTGGNTFYLLHWMRESGFDKLVSDYVHKGGVYVGASAGSYVACPTIEMATWKHQDRNRVGLQDLTALNLVNFLVTAHFEEKYHDIVEKEAENNSYPIVALSDQQAVLVLGKTVKVIGEGKKEFWNGFREFR